MSFRRIVEDFGKEYFLYLWAHSLWARQSLRQLVFRRGKDGVDQLAHAPFEGCAAGFAFGQEGDHFHAHRRRHAAGQMHVKQSIDNLFAVLPSALNPGVDRPVVATQQKVLHIAKVDADALQTGFESMCVVLDVDLAMLLQQFPCDSAGNRPPAAGGRRLRNRRPMALLRKRTSFADLMLAVNPENLPENRRSPGWPGDAD